jgi:hypothetical protein
VIERAYVDTSFIYALTMERDPNHQAAATLHAGFEGQMLASIFVVAETMSLITKRRGKQQAISIGRDLISSERTRILYPEGLVLRRAWREFATYPDWDFDLVDAISFALMKREEIEVALTFDRHFAQMGFEALPG